LFGWVFTEESLESAEKVMALVSNGCTYALEVMEDGETNYSGLFTGLDWNTYLRQPAVLASTMPEAYGQLYPAEWMTLPEYSRRNEYVTRNYNGVYHELHSQERRDGFEDLLQNGSDRYVLHAANSLVFGEYLDSVLSSEEELEAALEILAMAFSLDINNDFGECQATNALSNSGVLYYQAGRLDLAEKQLLAAIDLECGSADEANFVLSLLYEELGNEEAARKHRYLGQNYNNRSQLRRPRSIDSAPTSTKPEGKFCTSCGKVFLRPQQKFCAGCGTER
jgi:tetratricopeptide (TPR) repeat protein